MNTDDKEEQQPTVSSPKKPKVKRCPICGATIVWVNNYTQHLKSKKHKDALYVLTEQFDFIH